MHYEGDLTFRLVHRGFGSPALVQDRWTCLLYLSLYRRRGRVLVLLADSIYSVRVFYILLASSPIV